MKAIHLGKITVVIAAATSLLSCAKKMSPEASAVPNLAGTWQSEQWDPTEWGKAKHILIFDSVDKCEAITKFRDFPAGENKLTTACRYRVNGKLVTVSDIKSHEFIAEFRLEKNDSVLRFVKGGGETYVSSLLVRK